MGHEPHECAPQGPCYTALATPQDSLRTALVSFTGSTRGEGSTRPEPQQGSGSWVGTQAVRLEHLFSPVSNGPAVNVLYRNGVLVEVIENA